MEVSPYQGCKANLEKVKEQFEQWRMIRGKSRKIPDSLWEAAASLYPAHSLHQISRTLGLNHTALKQRTFVEVSDGSSAREAFIELGFAPSPGIVSPRTIEIWQGQGCCMIIRNADAADIQKIGELFIRRP